MTSSAINVIHSANRIVLLSQLQVDLSYQRNLNKAGMKAIVRNFKPECIGSIIVGQRKDKSLWIVDGNTRVEALKLLGFKEFLVRIFASRGRKHEAEVFRICGVNRKNISARAKYKAMLAEGNKVALTVKRAVESCGYKIEDGGSRDKLAVNKKVGCIAAILDIGEKSGAPPIKFALSTIDKCWPGNKYGVNHRIIDGLAEFYNQNEGEIEMDKFVECLKQMEPYRIIEEVQKRTFGGSPATAAANLFEERYTGKKKGARAHAN